MQYGEIALVYDSLMYDMPYSDWAEYIRKNIKGDTVLELGCGTGSITEKLSAYYDVTALDISEDMLEAAREKLMSKGRQARLINGDMCDFSLHKPVDSVVCICDGINYLITPEKVKQAFLNVYKNVKSGGRFIFDISSEYKLFAMENELYSEDNDTVTYIWRNTVDEDKKLIEMDITFFVNEEDERYFRFDEKHVQRMHSVDEITLWLKECGFKIISVTDNYTDKEITDETMRITFCAEKI